MRSLAHQRGVRDDEQDYQRFYQRWAQSRNLTLVNMPTPDLTLTVAGPVPVPAATPRVLVAEHNKALPVDRVCFNYNHSHNALNTRTRLIDTGHPRDDHRVSRFLGRAIHVWLGENLRLWVSVRRTLPAAGGALRLRLHRSGRRGNRRDHWQRNGEPGGDSQKRDAPGLQHYTFRRYRTRPAHGRRRPRGDRNTGRHVADGRERIDLPTVVPRRDGPARLPAALAFVRAVRHPAQRARLPL